MAKWKLLLAMEIGTNSKLQNGERRDILFFAAHYLSRCIYTRELARVLVNIGMSGRSSAW